jgi:hypothetical protein
MDIQDIAFATIGKDGKDDHCLSLGNDEIPEVEAPEIAFATIGKDGKDDSCLTMSESEDPETEAQQIQL